MSPDVADGFANPRGYGIAAVERTTDLVIAMVRLGPASVTSLAQGAGCTTATAFRILHTLQARGLASQQGKRGAWQLGVGWLAVARAAMQQGAMETAAYPSMAGLALGCGEPVTLTVRDGEQALVTAVCAGTTPARLFTAAGERWPMHAGPGRLLLAYAPAAIQKAVLASRLPRLAANTRTEATWLADQLPRIRARNWLITTDDLADGAVTVSTAVRDSLGEVVGALSIASPALRMRSPRPHTLLTPLLDAAEQITQAFGMGG